LVHVPPYRLRPAPRHGSRPGNARFTRDMRWFARAS
jgi:hypothetical protein